MLESHLELTVEKPAAGGRMIARHEGQIVLVAAAIPGERVRARVERQAKGVVYATTIEVLHPSADRRVVEGDWLCGGNVYAHVAYSRQLDIKAAIIEDAFARIGRMDLAQVVRRPTSDVGSVAVTGSQERGYRMRARLHVRGGRVGFFREGTHDLCDAGGTGQLLPGTIEVLERIKYSLRGEGVSGVTSLELAENMPGDQRAVHVEIERPVDLSIVAEEAGAALTGLGYSGPFSRFATIVAGNPVVFDRVPIDVAAGRFEMTLQHNVQAFFQGNRYLLPRLVSRVVSLVDAGPVVDLYAGVGLFGVALAACGRSDITAVEGDRISAQDLKANAAPHGKAIAAMQQPVESFITGRRAPEGSTLIVDPPRTGMSREALAGIVAFGAQTVVYVSCDVATLARDTRRLVDAGYTLEHVEGFDLFPNTAHVETVVRLRKSRRSEP